MAADGSFCLFHCESLPFAVAVANVAEIAEVDALVCIGLCPPRIAGLCPYHRQVVPVVTLGRGLIPDKLPASCQRIHIERERAGRGLSDRANRPGHVGHPSIDRESTSIAHAAACNGASPTTKATAS